MGSFSYRQFKRYLRSEVRLFFFLDDSPSDGGRESQKYQTPNKHWGKIPYPLMNMDRQGPL